MRQGNSPFAQDYIEDALRGNVDITRLLVALFEARFDPAPWPATAARPTEEERSRQRILAALDDVASLDHDRILRSYLTHIRATLRTNYFQHVGDESGGGPHTYMSFKLEPSAIPDLPEPRPQFEIFVYSPRVEGVHLRFGAGRARRPALVGPARRLPHRGARPGQGADGEEHRDRAGGREGRLLLQAAARPVATATRGWPRAWPATRPSSPACSTSPTTWSTAETVPPRGRRPPRRRRLLPGRGRRQGHGDVLRHRQRRGARTTASGSATRSPAAARSATTTRRWASPPAAPGSRCSGTSASAASTARPRTSPASASATCRGDVFGNGLLCSEHTRLVAAFDHRDIFLDPDARRGDVVRRAAAAVRAAALELAGLRHEPDLRGRRGLPALAQVDPAQRRRSATALGHRRVGRGDDPGRADEGDPAGAGRPALERRHRHLRQGRGRDPRRRRRQGQRRDPGRRPRAAGAVRRRGRQPRAAPRRGRIEYALHGRRACEDGGRINTDFIDNSAGVDTSDHEVNIKILLDRVVKDGDLTEKQRNKLLAEMTDEVAELVLRDNYEQNLALANAAAQRAVAAARARGVDAPPGAATARSTASSRGCPRRRPGAAAARPRRGPDRRPSCRC